jgi:hypothetical protein
MTALELSHAELRAALIIAGKEIRNLNFGKKDTPLLRTLRRVLRESRTVANGDRMAVQAARHFRTAARRKSD